MKKKHNFILASFFLCSWIQAREPLLLPKDSINPNQLLSSPAAIGTQGLAQELVLMHKVEKERTPFQVKQALADDADESIFLFSSIFGSQFNADTLPLTAGLSAKVKNDSSWVGSPAKAKFLRPHPYHADKSLQPVCPTKDKQDSYPSGHTLVGYMQALVLIDMIPEQSEAILQRAAEYAHHRVICGVNYPSDLEASRLLAYSAYAVMRNQASYIQELAAAKQEVRRVLRTP